MNLDVKFSLEAEETFDALVIQLKNRWGYGLVTKFENKVLKSLQTISKTPFTYPVIEENLDIRNAFFIKTVQ